MGPGNISSLNLASSLAGSQRNTAASDEIKQQASERKFQIDRDAATAHSLEDVGETETNPERDADGRMPMGYDDIPPDVEAHDEQEQDSEEKTLHRRSVDATGERGRLLDVEA
ncbi:MAG: hypothetical protein Tsb009_30590 [Planctomycetaceae bacterium]